MDKSVKKISIIGGSGTGKSTLSNSMSKDLGLPVYHLDATNYHANWVTRDKAERDSMIREIISKDEWITDGTYRTTIDERLAKSDLVIYLDYSTWAQVKGIVKRCIKNGGKEKAEIPGCKEQFTMEFFWWTVKYRKNRRPEILEAISKVNQDKLTVFKSRRQLKKWYKQEFGKKITVN